MIYYIYSYTIARTDGLLTEIKNHRLDRWVEVTDAILWKRIQQEGEKVSEKEAGERYTKFHRDYQKFQG